MALLQLYVVKSLLQEPNMISYKEVKVSLLVFFHCFALSKSVLEVKKSGQVRFQVYSPVLTSQEVSITDKCGEENVPALDTKSANVDFGLDELNTEYVVVLLRKNTVAGKSVVRKKAVQPQHKSDVDRA